MACLSRSDAGHDDCDYATISSRTFLSRHLVVQGDSLNTLWPLSCLLAHPDRVLKLSPHQERVFLFWEASRVIGAIGCSSTPQVN